MNSAPRVRVVVLNFDGGQMTIDCLESLLATDWPADSLEIVMVDNGSLDDVVERVRRFHPAVRVLEPLANLGFAGGCNVGMTAASVGGFEPEFVALVNNDATVDAGWLRALHRAVTSASDVGAASAKMLFTNRAIGVEFDVGGGSDFVDDDSKAGVCITGLRVDGSPAESMVTFDEGVHGPTPPDAAAGDEMRRWTKRRFTIRRTLESEETLARTRLAVRLSAESERVVAVRGDGLDLEWSVTSDPRWFEVDIPLVSFDVINNAGSNLYSGGFGGDRGFLERDRGQYNEPAEVFAWCGGAVLLKQEFLDTVGVFDERLFLYYEDTDLSWRGRLQGWRYVYEPTAVVRHRHAQSSGVGSPVFRFHTERNRLLVLAKCAPLGVAVRSGLGELRRMIVRNARDLLLRPLTLKIPVRVEAAHRRRVFFSYLSLLPGMIRDRVMMDRRVSRRSLMRWQVSK